MSTPRQILPVGRHAVLAEYESLTDTMSAYQSLSAVPLAGTIELVPAARTILVRFGVQTTSAAITHWLQSASGDHEEPGEARAVSIDVVYDGDDLGTVAAMLDTSIDSVIARHTSTAYRVAFTGFAPGFAYLATPDYGLHVARRESPRARVPAGSVGLAGEFSGIYPRATPGGWQLIGRTGAQIWDDEREPPALLQAGMAVSFRAVREVAVAAQSSQKTFGGSSLTILQPGPQLTVQDRGRPGNAAAGVTTSGAMDRRSHAQANTAVGNTRDAATIEIAFGGAELLVTETSVLAVTGADNATVLVHEDGREEPIVRGIPFLAPAGSCLVFGWASRGVRTYLAARGGFDSVITARSRSTDTLSGLGPAPLTAGDRVSIRQIAPTSAATQVQPGTGTPLLAAGETIEIDITLGPRDNWFAPGSVAELQGQTWTVSGLSDRIGARIEAEHSLERSVIDELPSEGVVRGAIQVPPSGQPVIFLADHPVTGGYPVIAVVVPEDCDRVAQLPPGARIRFRVRPLITGERCSTDNPG